MYFFYELYGFHLFFMDFTSFLSLFSLSDSVTPEFPHSPQIKDNVTQNGEKKVQYVFLHLFHLQIHAAGHSFYCSVMFLLFFLDRGIVCR